MTEPMTPGRLADLRQTVRMFGGATPAAQVAAELLAEVERLRAALPPEPPDPCSVTAVAVALNVSPRTVRMWVDGKRLKATPDGRIDARGLIEFLRSHGWERERLARAARELGMREEGDTP